MNSGSLSKHERISYIILGLVYISLTGGVQLVASERVIFDLLRLYKFNLNAHSGKEASEISFT